MPISDPDEPKQTWDEPKIKCRPGQAKEGPTDTSGPAMSNPEQTQQFQLSQALSRPAKGASQKARKPNYIRGKSEIGFGSVFVKFILVCYSLE